MSCSDVDYLKIVNGDLYLAKRDANGKAGKLENLGDFPMFSLSATAEYAENYNSRGRFKVRDVRFARQVTMAGKITIKDATAKNLAKLLYGAVNTLTGATTTDEPFPRSDCANGEMDLVPGVSIPSALSAFSIKDSAGTPATLSLTTKYTVDLDNGIVTWVDVAGYTQPFKATYTQANRELVSFARNAAADDEYYAVLVGENAANNYEKTKVVLYRVSISPGSLQIVDTESNEAAGKYEIDLIPLADLCRTESDSDKF